MSKAREFWLAGLNSHDVCVFDQKTVSSFRHDFNKNNEYIHVIELTPEVSRKLELFDEAVKYLDQAARQWKMHVENFAQDDLETVLKEDHKNIEAQELSRCLQFLKKLGEHNE